MEIRSEESDALAEQNFALHKMNEAQRGDSGRGEGPAGF